MTQNAMRNLAVDIMAESLRQGAVALGYDKETTGRARDAYVELTGREPDASAQAETDGEKLPPATCGRCGAVVTHTNYYRHTCKANDGVTGDAGEHGR